MKVGPAQRQVDRSRTPERLESAEEIRDNIEEGSSALLGTRVALERIHVHWRYPEFNTGDATQRRPKSENLLCHAVCRDASWCSGQCKDGV